jgi:hypothetical protein
MVQPNGCFKCGELGHYANIVLSVECRLRIREMVSNWVSRHHRLALEIQTLQATKHNRIMCVAK